MDLAGYVINAVLVERRSVKEVCEAHDISRSWLYELIARYRQDGEEGLRAQSKRPRTSPRRVPAAMEDEIVALRKELTDLGVDAGAQTIHYHLQVRHRCNKRSVPSVATIWRVLARRGFVIPQPQKRPKSSWRQRRARTVAQLQAQLDRFRTCYNTVRSHRAIRRATPAQAFAARTKATPRRPGISIPAQHRVRRDRIDSGGKVTLRYHSRLLHLGVGRRYAGTRVLLLVKDRDVRVINDNGELLATFTLDPNKQYQTQHRPGQQA